MHTRASHALALSLTLTVPAIALAQSLPTSQPPLLRIVREDVKPGHAADHIATESGWPAAFAKAKFPDYYLAWESMTNNEVWFAIPHASYAAMGESLAREAEPALAAELARVSKADGEHVTSLRTLELRARPELSHGAYPNLGSQRFWEVTVFRVRPGGEEAFAAIAKAYGAASDRAGRKASYRVYEVQAGMPAPTFLVFSSASKLGDFDTMLADGDATMKAMTTPDAADAIKAFQAGLINSETWRFRLSPEMSYVPAEVRASDPAFWKVTK
jgi:hypothetical protein